MPFSQKQIVITGAASGIGKALIYELAAFECHILAIDRDEQGLKKLEEAFFGAKMRIQILVLDLTSPVQIQKLVTLAVEKLGGIDLFFANAGVALYGDFKTQDFESRQALLMVNLVAPIEGLHQMLQVTSGKPFSYIITASAMAKIGMPNYAMYGATKAALDRFADSFSFENNPGCHLMLVYPIATRTDFFSSKENAPIPWPSQSAQQVASSILKAVVKKKRQVYPSWLFRGVISLQLLNQWLMQPYQYWNKNRKAQK